MKHFLFLLFFTVLPLVNMFGAEPTTNKSKLILSTRPTHHQVPSIVVIDCVYFYDAMHFCFPEQVEYAQVDIVDASGRMVASDTVYAENSVMEVSLTEGEYEITCRTDGNQTFSGVIYIQ